MKKKYTKCPVVATLDVIGGKWKPLIIWHLRNEVQRFNHFQKLMSGITHKMLTQQLRELELDDVIYRSDYNEKIPRVEYGLTEYGQTLIPVLKSMELWGEKHSKRFKTNTPLCAISHLDA